MENENNKLAEQVSIGKNTFKTQNANEQKQQSNEFDRILCTTNERLIRWTYEYIKML